jgi:hypothetical protein
LARGVEDMLAGAGEGGAGEREWLSSELENVRTALQTEVRRCRLTQG